MHGCCFKKNIKVASEGPQIQNCAQLCWRIGITRHERARAHLCSPILRQAIDGIRMTIDMSIAGLLQRLFLTQTRPIPGSKIVTAVQRGWPANGQCLRERLPYFAR